MISRSILKETKETANDFKVVCVTGPRQSGKTTLCKQVFKNKPYVTLEDPDIATIAKSNERKFLNQFKNGAILDEVQRVPTLFNYLQGIVDSKNKNNQFVLTGSNNFLMQQNISFRENDNLHITIYLPDGTILNFDPTPVWFYFPTYNFPILSNPGKQIQAIFEVIREEKCC